jgi:hypothetical protein
MTALVRPIAAGTVALAVALAALPAEMNAQPEAVTPAACTVEPRAEDEVAGLVVVPSAPLPDAAPTTGDRGNALIDRFQGEPADPETVAGVEIALAAYAGCINANDRPRLLAVVSDRLAAEAATAWETAAAAGDATPAAGSGAPPLLVAASLEGWDAPSLTIAALRVREVLVLPDGRAVAYVAWQLSGDDAETYRDRELVVLKPIDDRWALDYASGAWLVDGETFVEPPASAGLEAPEDIPNARGGYGEVDSAAYAEPTMAGFEFAIAVTLMAASDAAGEGVGCEFIAIERGVRSVTGSASCRADEAVAGLPAYLIVEVHDSRRPGDGPPLRCEDAAPLAAYVTYACTVELPKPAP